MRAEMRTPRLKLRPLTLSDVPRLVHLGNDPRIARMVMQIPLPYTAADAAEFVARQPTVVQQDGRIWGVEDSAGLQGVVGFYANAKQPVQAELGYWFGVEAWGKGYATEAGRVLVEEGFTKGGRSGKGFKELIAGQYLDNPPSGHVLAKLGFRASGEVMPLFSLGRREESPCAIWRMKAAEKPAPLPFLETERLILGPLAHEDAAELAKIGNEPEIARWMANLPSPFAEEAALARIQKSRFRGAPGFRLGIRRRAEGDLIGELGVGPADKAGWPDVSYWLGREFRGRGYAREAAGALADYLFAAFKPARLRAETSIDNAPSRRLLEALGFAEAGSYLLGEDLIRRYDLRRAVWTAARASGRKKPGKEGAT